MVLHSSAFCSHSASRNLKIGYFSQHHVEQLDLNVSAVELLARKFPGMLGIGFAARVFYLILASRPVLGHY